MVSEIWSVKVKSRGHVYLSRRVYSAKYGILVHQQLDDEGGAHFSGHERLFE